MRTIFIALTVLSVLVSAPFTEARFGLFGYPLYFPEIAVLLALIIALASKTLPSFSLRPPMLPILQSVLVLGVLVSALAHPDPHGFGIIKSWFLFPLLFSWLLIAAAATIRDRRALLYGWHGALTIITLIAFGYWLRSDASYDGRLHAFFLSPNHLALFLFPAPILSVFLLRRADSPTGARFFFGAILLLSSFVLFQTFSYTVWISVFVGLSVYFLFHPGTVARFGIKKILLSSLCALGMFASLFWLTQHDNPKLAHWTETPERSSLASRIMIWKASWLMLEHHPILGIGPGRFQTTYLDYQRFFPPYLEWAVPEPHQIFLAFWLESGLLGLLGFLSLISWWLSFLWKGATADQDTVWLAFALMASILIQGLFDTPYWKTDLSYLFWTLIALGIIATKKLPKEPQATIIQGQIPRA